jgi:hypothetical protein
MQVGGRSSSYAQETSRAAAGKHGLPLRWRLLLVVAAVVPLLIFALGYLTLGMPRRHSGHRDPHRGSGAQLIAVLSNLDSIHQTDAPAVSNLFTGAESADRSSRLKAR